ncbi:two-component system response regulator NarL [Pleionea sediminis]|uniref:two-component system response regulator NarL n=1 Tax=Pleionea sediminis TaxID=2569479 RepID=UPI001186C1E0|nr:two-component system response regulator NarL [Pleionea sediminis]
MSAASVFMIDDHPLFRKGVHQLIEMEDDLVSIGEASSGEDAIHQLKNIPEEPDLIILDLNMQGMDGLETLRSLRAMGISSKIIMLTVSDNDADVIDCIRAGADGYLLKDMDPEDIIEKIKAATIGKLAISERLTEVLATALRKPDKDNGNLLSSLTSRELEILNRISRGLSNKLIARELDISDGTVKVHVKHLLKKLNMKSRVEAAVWMVSQKRK